MANPKRKISKQRGRKRRTHWKLTAPAISTCKNCGEPKVPHRVCPSCGYYKDQQVLFVSKAS